MGVLWQVVISTAVIGGVSASLLTSCRFGEVYLDSSQKVGTTVPKKRRLDSLNENLAYGAGGGT